MEGEEVERSGILIIGVIITFFATMTSKDENRSKIKPIAVIVIIQLIIVLLAFPLSTATQSGLDNFYGESEGAIITVIYPNSPAFDSTLQTGDIITEIRLIRDGLSTTDITISSSSEFNRALAQIPPGIEFIIANSEDLQIIIEGIVPPEDVSQQSGSYLGLLTEDFREPHGIFSVLFPLWMEILFRWVINIGLLFSVYSLLPLPRTQGYNLMSEINEIYGFELSDRIKGYISYVSLIVFALNVLYFVF